MNFHVDSHYLIGSSHSVCEDYAFHTGFNAKKDGELIQVCPVAVIADGCSDSQESDIGARIMAHFVKQKMFESFLCGSLNTNSFFKERFALFANHLREKMCEMNLPSIKSIGLPSESLDATVWIMGAETGDNGSDAVVAVGGWGDGSAIVKRKSGITIYCVTYESSAPFYLSYDLDYHRTQRYLKTFQNTYLLSTVIIKLDGTSSMIHEECSCNKHFTLQVLDNIDDPVISVSICSDGYKTYTNITEPFLGSLEWAATRMIDYPTIEGVFVERSMRFLEKQDIKNGIHHFDDISMASIAFNAPNLPRSEA